MHRVVPAISRGTRTSYLLVADRLLSPLRRLRRTATGIPPSLRVPVYPRRGDRWSTCDEMVRSSELKSESLIYDPLSCPTAAIRSVAIAVVARRKVERGRAAVDRFRLAVPARTQPIAPTPSWNVHECPRSRPLRPVPPISSPLVPFYDFWLDPGPRQLCRRVLSSMLRTTSAARSRAAGSSPCHPGLSRIHW